MIGVCLAATQMFYVQQILLRRLFNEIAHESSPSEEGLYVVIWLCAPVKQREAQTKETRKNLHKKTSS